MKISLIYIYFERVGLGNMFVTDVVLRPISHLSVPFSQVKTDVKYSHVSDVDLPNDKWS